MDVYRHLKTVGITILTTIAITSIIILLLKIVVTKSEAIIMMRRKNSTNNQNDTSGDGSAYVGCQAHPEREGFP